MIRINVSVHTAGVKKVGLIFAVLLGLPLIGTLFVDVDTSPTPDDIALEASVRARIDVLDAIPKGWSDDWSDKSCDPAILQAAGEIPTLSLLQVKHFAGYEPDASIIEKEREVELVSSPLSFDDILINDTSKYKYRSVAGQNTDYQVESLREVYAAKLLAVLETRALNIPSSVKFTGQFYGGNYEGGLRILDATTGETLCQGKILASSANEVDSGLFERGNDAIKRDFQERLDAAKAEAIAKIAAGATVAW